MITIVHDQHAADFQWWGMAPMSAHCKIVLTVCCSRVEVISWSPRAFIYHNFLSDSEISHMVQLVEDKVRAATEASSGPDLKINVSLLPVAF